MSSNPCKHGDREKDQNNNFVNATAHGGAGIDREARARRIASRSAREEHQQREVLRGARNQHYYHSHHQQQKSSQTPSAGGGQRGERDTAPGAGCNGGGPQVTAKVMWGNVSAIKELRDQEQQSERQLGTRAAGRRQ